MFYPDHHIRGYCLYLGSIVFKNQHLDMGVYEAPDGEVSHAVVYGAEDRQYLSGEIDFRNDSNNFQGAVYKFNQALYEDHLKRKEGRS